jgi:hypothetical protein
VRDKKDSFPWCQEEEASLHLHSTLILKFNVCLAKDLRTLLSKPGGRKTPEETNDASTVDCLAALLVADGVTVDGAAILLPADALSGRGVKAPATSDACCCLPPSFPNDNDDDDMMQRQSESLWTVRCVCAGCTLIKKKRWARSDEGAEEHCFY